ncbi:MULTISPECIES: DUF2158 domain-containing protein [unclassified Candidatus Accumulibacter]|jgi:uncharacterized protein YodC (DUF2158 family)|uniref:YodC family protein n=1 Tax=unclassified Candidatus Accumulibacter TaxID=2619054 RepID=UPI001AC54B7A|nr:MULTISPECIES: DUF2158 domain-containing protein [unclassified Candidatus Accumulibacter]MBN8513529.1 DUF2158 domain-containing protein [Accumulibacter sp.]MBO3701793.1 DUF2158 domain-containing protein [Accumulibacter sp.]HRE72598.1 DUF2158 domain-containing protein [Accumulibacter sp.]
MRKQSCFQVGDIVQLKSGGPEMTVQKINDIGDDVSTVRFRCQWFAGKKLESGSFPEESLKPVTQEQK